MRIEIEHVKFIPKVLSPSILYVSREFEIAIHLCPCGCGSKIRTPLGPVDWKLRETKNGPSLYPSIGNWQLPCQSHYWIKNGYIQWADSWNKKKIAKSWNADQARRIAYYNQKQSDTTLNLWQKIKKLFLNET